MGAYPSRPTLISGFIIFAPTAIAALAAVAAADSAGRFVIAEPVAVAVFPCFGRIFAIAAVAGAVVARIPVAALAAFADRVRSAVPARCSRWRWQTRSPGLRRSRIETCALSLSPDGLVTHSLVRQVVRAGVPVTKEYVRTAISIARAMNL